MPWMDEIEHIETGQTLVVYTVDADEYLAGGAWKRVRSDLPVQPSIRQRPGGVLGQSEIQRRGPELVVDSGVVVNKGARK